MTRTLANHFADQFRHQNQPDQHHHHHHHHPQIGYPQQHSSSILFQQQLQHVFQQQFKVMQHQKPLVSAGHQQTSLYAQTNRDLVAGLTSSSSPPTIDTQLPTSQAYFPTNSYPTPNSSSSSSNSPSPISMSHPDHTHAHSHNNNLNYQFGHSQPDHGHSRLNLSAIERHNDDNQFHLHVHNQQHDLTNSPVNHNHSNNIPIFHISSNNSNNNNKNILSSSQSSSSDAAATTFKSRRSDAIKCNSKASGNQISKRSARAQKSKRIRTIFTPEQLKRLEQEFSHQMYLVGQDRGFLAKSLNLTESQVKVWFQNRRIKSRKVASPGHDELTM